ncbi:hypothetical protein B7P43_G12722 [Cryptotermes secundus]|uniref:Ion transport domain-containing protein n=2 Tax=Cryptotermes secundus TaxID=105785 RepID=A0A2J7PZ35_9NEOP|nr:hypothetical protein B7P43_G12722 [Cryptotermes secundus]
MLLSEGAFAAGMIFSYMKLVHIFSVNPHLGPLQISLGRMIIDILKFFFIYSLVLFAFGCGMNQLLWYYADLEKRKCYHRPDGLADFDNEDKACSIWRRFANLFETSQSLFWAGFGLVDLMAFELKGIKSFTRFWALLMFGSYSVINIIVLLNMLIAMMSNSYQIISERSDTEWKFARSRLWMSYFEEGDTVPPPFNLIPTTKCLTKYLGSRKGKKGSGSVMRKSRKRAVARHEAVMHILVRRYVTGETRKRDESGITEDDVMEIRQDISTLRYELIDILKNNGMNTPKLDQYDVQVPGKKNRIMERRLQKGFQIGFVERILTEVIEDNKEPRDVFSKIAQAIHHHGSSQSKKKDWNAMVRRNTIVRDPIGSSSVADLQKSRQSMKQQIVRNNMTALLSMDAEKLVEYNPKLSEVTPATRVAYAKFKAANLAHKRDDIDNIAEENVIENSNNLSVSDEMSQTKESYDCHPENKISQTDMIKPASIAGPSCIDVSASCSTAVHDELPPGDLSTCTETKPDETANSSVHDEASTIPTFNTSFSSVRKDFRTTTPIQEEDEEKNAEYSEEAEANCDMDINRGTLEPNTTETMSLQKPPMKTGGKSKLSGEVITGWL